MCLYIGLINFQQLSQNFYALTHCHKSYLDKCKMLSILLVFNRIFGSFKFAQFYKDHQERNKRKLPMVPEK